MFLLKEKMKGQFLKTKDNKQTPTHSNFFKKKRKLEDKWIQVDQLICQILLKEKT